MCLEIHFVSKSFTTVANKSQTQHNCLHRFSERMEMMQTRKQAGKNV